MDGSYPGLSHETPGPVLAGVVVHCRGEVLLPFRVRAEHMRYSPRRLMGDDCPACLRLVPYVVLLSH